MWARIKTVLSYHLLNTLGIFLNSLLVFATSIEVFAVSQKNKLWHREASTQNYMVQNKISASKHGSNAQNLNYFCKIKANLNLTAPFLYLNHLFTVWEEKYQETVYKKNFEPRDPSDHLVWLPEHHGYRVAKMKYPLFLHFIHQHSHFLMALYLAGFVAIIRTQGCLTYSEKGFSKILVNNLLLNFVCYEKEFFVCYND